MRRDWGCIAELLGAIEALADPFDAPPLGRLAAGEAAALEHLELLIEAGLVKLVERSRTPVLRTGLRLSWAGHELLDHLRSPRLRERVQALADGSDLFLSHEAFTALATASLRRWHGGSA